MRFASTVRENRRTFLKGTGCAIGAGVLDVGATGTATAGYSVDSDLTEPAGVTGRELADAIQAVSSGTPIASLGDTFVAVEDVVEGDPICQEFDGL